MKLKDLAKTPELIQIVIDDEEIIKEYGEPLEFWTYDRQPMETFLKFASGDNKDFASMAMVLKDMVLTESGEPVITEGQILPSRVMVATFTRLASQLGK
jgi:hypothetical protein